MIRLDDDLQTRRKKDKGVRRTSGGGGEAPGSSPPKMQLKSHTLTKIKLELTQIAFNTTFQPPGASLLTLPSLVTPQNLIVILRNQANVPICSPRPPINTFVPTSACFPCQEEPPAMPEPLHWIKKERMSKRTKVRVMRWAGMRKMVCLCEGRTAWIRRPMRR